MDHYRFFTTLTIRVNDLNYGGHVGHQHYFSFFQEARMAYLQQFGYVELDIDGLSMMVAEAGCRYKRELLLGETIDVGCRVSSVRSKIFTMDYRIEKAGLLAAEGFTRNVCVDKQTHKAVSPTRPFVDAVCEFEGLAAP